MSIITMAMVAGPMGEDEVKKLQGKKKAHLSKAGECAQ